MSKTAIVSLAVDRGGSVLAVGTHDHGVELWDANTLEPGFAVDAAEGRPFALAFRGTHLLSAGDDGVLVDVDLASPSRAATRIPLHTDAVLDVDATPSGLVWASRSGAVAAVRDATDPSILLEPGPRLQSDWSLWPLPARSEGSRLVVGDQGGQIWLSDRTGAPTLASQASSALVSLVWRDGWYASRADGSVIRWEALGSAPQTLWKQGDPVWLSAGTREVAAIRADGRVGRVDETRIAWLTSLPALGPDPPRAAVLDDTVAVRVGSSLHRVDLDDGTSAPLLELEDYPRSLEADPKRHQWLVTTKGRLSAVGRDGSLRFSTYLAPFLGVVRVVDDLAVVVTGERELTLFSLVERRALGPALRVPEGIVQGLQVADDDAVTVLVTSFSERTYRLRAYRLALSRESWRRHARRTANRAMSDAEASRFGL
ncbi:MAG: WD40 repeat domain-containing protein [Myxococcota bacterium]